MRAAEKIFDGEFADVMDDDVLPSEGASKSSGRAERPRMIVSSSRMPYIPPFINRVAAQTPEDDNSDAEIGSDFEVNDDDAEDDDGESFPFH